MVGNDVGGNGSAMVTRRKGSVILQDFWPAGRLVPFPHDAMTALVTEATPLGKRAFLMGVIEGEGEVCDPVNGSCATAQIADNSRSIGGGTNPDFYRHIVALLQPAIDAGLVTAFTAAAQGCVPQPEAQRGGGQWGCAVHTQQRLRRDQGLARRRVQARAGLRLRGGLRLRAAGRAVRLHAAAPAAPASSADRPGVGSGDPGLRLCTRSIPPGGPGSLWWTTAGMDADSCKPHGRGGAGLPPADQCHRLAGAASQIKDGTTFTLICFSGTTKVSKSFTVTVR